MHRIQRTIDIKAPVQRVYDTICQPTNLPGIWPNMQSVSNLVPHGDGTYDFDWVYKMAGMHFRGHTRVEDAQPARYFRIRNEGEITGAFRWTFTGLDGMGTRLSVDIEYTIPTPLIGKIVESLVAKSNERDLDVLLGNLRDWTEHFAAENVIEAKAAPAPARAH